MLANVFEFIYTKILKKYFQKHLLPQCEILPKKKEKNAAQRNLAHFDTKLYDLHKYLNF
jgi:hypothetical protein